MMFGNFAVFATSTLVTQLLTNATFEETFAAFATNRSIMPTARSITANDAQFQGKP